MSTDVHPMTAPRRRAQEIAARGLIYHCHVGSTVHGLNLEGQDDRDEMGVCVEPRSSVIGLERFEQFTWRSQPEGVQSGPGDLDLVVYSLRKFVALAAGGNPTITQLLFTPQDSIMHSSSSAVALRRLAPDLISKRHVKAYLGYLNAQKLRLLGLKGQKRVKRPALVEEHGYDTKYAMHAVRLGFEGFEIGTTGHLSLPLREGERQACMEIRRGEWPQEKVIKLIDSLEQRMQGLLSSGDCELPDGPNYERLNRFLIHVHDVHWRFANLTDLPTLGHPLIEGHPLADGGPWTHEVSP